MRLRAKIGHIYPAAGVTGELELYKMVPRDVAICTTRIRMVKATAEELDRLVDYVEEAAELLAMAKVDVVAFNCTLASLMGGVKRSEEIIKRVKKKMDVPVVTTALAIVKALKKLKAKKIALVSPYVHEMNELERLFLAEQGIEVIAMKGLGLTDPQEQAAVEPESWYEMVKEVQVDSLDGFLISCSGIRVVDIIDKAEKASGKVVVTSNQAVLWACLRELGIDETIEGFGKLLREA